MSNTTERCRNAKELNVLVQVLLDLALADIKRQGVNPLVIETYRSQERQNYLYCQGRTIAECTAKGISSTFAKAYCTPKAHKVTWTRNSVHTSRKAVDIVPQRMVNGKMTAIWNSKDTDTQTIIRIMQKYGFEPGANWSSNADSPHFQVDGEFESVFTRDKNTECVTKAIQSAINRKIKANLAVDGDWGANTVNAINEFRKSCNWSQNGKLGATALNKLLT